jgi:type IV secretory pathway TraG/TraD family ATPase VirD4
MNEAVALTLKQYRDATSVVLGVLIPAAVFGSIFAMLYRYRVPDWVSLLVSGVIAYEVFRMTITQKSGHRRGRRRVKYIEAKAIAQSYLRPGDHGIKGFGGVTLPYDARQKGVMIQGEMGSGKSTTMALLAEANVPTHLYNTRAVFTDVKTKLVSSLCGLGYPIERIKIFNPYDARCVGLDFCADIDTHDISLGVAQIFVPDEKDSNPFFSNAARLLMHGVMYSFIRTVDKTKEENERRLTTEEGFTVTSRLDDVRYSTQESLLPEFHWTLRDVCLALQDVSDAREILERHDETTI